MKTRASTGVRKKRAPFRMFIRVMVEKQMAMRPLGMSKLAR
jgi:hypothetical protein